MQDGRNGQISFRAAVVQAYRLVDKAADLVFAAFFAAGRKIEFTAVYVREQPLGFAEAPYFGYRRLDRFKILRIHTDSLSADLDSLCFRASFFTIASDRPNSAATAAYFFPASIAAKIF